MKILKSIFKWCTKTRLRKILSLILVFVIFLTSIKLIFISPPAAIASDVLLGFNEGFGSTINDNNSNITGTITNAAWKTSEFCKTGNCLYFDGTGDFVSFGDDADTDFVAATNFTIEGWFRTPDITSGQRTLVAKHNATAGGYKVYMDSSGYLIFGVDDDSTWTPDDSVSTTTSAFDDNKWHFFSAVKTGTTSITLYVDGKQYQTDSSIAATGSLVNSDILYVGIDGNGSSNAFSGFLDEVKIYTTTARTNTEINADFTGVTPTRGTSVSFGPDNSYLSSGLVGYWKMDESSTGVGAVSRNDSSGIGTTLTDTNTTASGNGKFSNGSDFELANSEYISASDDTALSITGSLTLSAWIKPETVTAGTYNIISKWDGSNESYRLMQNADEIRIEIDSNGNYVETTTSNLVVGTWYHIVGVYDATSRLAHIYINGSEATSSTTGTIPSSIGDDAGKLHVGAEDSTGGATGYYDGVIDEVRIYNRSFSIFEISKLYNWTPNPVGYWKFDENSGTTAYDYSSNGSNLTLTNTSWVSGKFGSGLGFVSNSTNNASTNDNATLSITGNLTLSAWIKPTAVTASTIFPIISKTPSYNLIQYGDEIRLYLNSSSIYVTTNSANLSVENWYHIESVYNASAQTVQIYINGILQASTTTGSIPSSLTDDASTLDVGRYQSDSSTNFSTSVLNSADDARVNYWNSNPVTLTDTVLDIGSIGITETAIGTRFTGVTIPNASTITSATLTLTCESSWTTANSLQAIAAAQAADNAGTFTTSGFDLSTATRPRTTYTSNWDLKNACPNINDTTSKDVTTQVQEVVDRGGWSSGNSIVFIVEDNGSANDEWQNFYSQNHASGQSPQISIDYSTVTLYYYSGQIDNVRIYNYVRTPSQVAEDMNADHPSPGSPVGSATAYWKFDEGYSTTAHDSSINANDLTLSTASWTNSAKFGKSFNGLTNIRASRTDDDDFDFAATDDFSLSVWFKSDSATNPSANEYLLEKGGNIATDAIGYAIYTSSASDGLICFGIDDDATTFPEDSICTTNDLYDNTWHHIIATKTGTSRLDLYVDGAINGTPDTSISATGTLANASTFYIGDTNGTDGTDEFLGDIDEVKIYRLALTPNQVKVEYNHGSAEQLGATGTTSTGVATFSDDNAYCPPGQGSTCVGPAGEWKLDENTGTSAYDSSASNYTGTLTNGPTWSTGKIGTAVKFDGSNDNITLGGSTNLLRNSSAGTISAWVQINATGVTKVIADISVGTSTNSRLELGVSSSSTIYCGGRAGDAESFQQADTSAPTLSVNTWYFVTCVVDYASDSVKIFVNDLQVTTSGTISFTAAGTSNTSPQAAYIGADASDGLTNPFSGLIDNVIIYNNSRTPAQIAWDYNHGAPFGWWKLDENTGTAANDSMGNSTAGTLTNTPTWVTGKFNYGVSFAGSNQHIIIGDDPDFDFADDEDMTLTAWFKHTTASSQEIILSKYAAAGYKIISEADGDITCALDYDSTWTPTDSVTSTLATYDDNTWHHIACVKSGATSLSLYIDGVLIGTDSSITATNTLTNADPLYLGIDADGAALDFTGSLDDVRIYRYPLTTQQINNIYNENSAVRFAQ